MRTLPSLGAVALGVRLILAGVVVLNLRLDIPTSLGRPPMDSRTVNAILAVERRRIAHSLPCTAVQLRLRTKRYTGIM